MRLNVQFLEGRHHAWLVTENAAELFIHQPVEKLQLMNGALVCLIDSDLAEEIRSDDIACEEDPSGVFLCCPAAKETKLYEVLQSVTYAGGDVLLFLKPIATFH